MNDYDLEDILIGLLGIVREKRRLEEENYCLKEKLEEYNSNLIETNRRTNDQVANILNTLIFNCIKE